MILCLAYVVDDRLKAFLVVDIECASTLSPPFLANRRGQGIMCGEWTETFLLQHLEPAGAPGFELLPDLLGFAVARHDDMHMVRAAIDGVESPSPHPAMIGNGQFDEPALVLVEKAGIIPQAGLRLAFASGIGKLPTVAVLDPPALIAGQPGAVRWPGRKIGPDLLICGILMWGQVGRFGLTGDRVDESQIGAGIGELGRVEMFQQMSDCAVGPRVRHRMDVHTQDPLLSVTVSEGTTFSAMWGPSWNLWVSMKRSTFEWERSERIGALERGFSSPTCPLIIVVFRHSRRKGNDHAQAQTQPTATSREGPTTTA